LVENNLPSKIQKFVFCSLHLFLEKKKGEEEEEEEEEEEKKKKASRIKPFAINSETNRHATSEPHIKNLRKTIELPFQA
jgi:uncharacterized Zn finger protein (UPF0148 family)